MFNKFAFIIILIFISNIYCGDSLLSKLVRRQIKSIRSVIFKALRSKCEKRSKERENVKDSDELHELKTSFKKQIMDRSVSSNEKMSSGFTSAKFHSFLNIKINYSTAADDPTNFFGSTPFVTDAKKIPEVGSAKECWSGSYWPMRNGLISVRYDKISKN